MPDSNPIMETVFKHMLAGLKRRDVLGKAIVSFELAQELIAATLEAGATQQEDAEVSEQIVIFTEDAAEFSSRVKVKGRAWPPRPPVDTKVGFKVNEIKYENEGRNGSISFTIEKPLEFSSKFVDLLAGLLGKLFKKLPVSLDELRREGTRITLDFADIIRTWQPELTTHSDNVKLLGMKVSESKVKFDIGFQ
ncbi:hypothetical protein OAU50_00385 [Planctomycetota bacterium]|nr:hypothetical protein [Planctomycetota bacterium]